jgi:hypothetical protein
MGGVKERGSGARGRSGREKEKNKRVGSERYGRPYEQHMKGEERARSE